MWPGSLVALARGCRESGLILSPLMLSIAGSYWFGQQISAISHAIRIVQSDWSKNMSLKTAATRVVVICGAIAQFATSVPAHAEGGLRSIRLSLPSRTSDVHTLDHLFSQLSNEHPAGLVSIQRKFNPYSVGYCLEFDGPEDAELALEEIKARLAEAESIDGTPVLAQAECAGNDGPLFPPAPH